MLAISGSYLRPSAHYFYTKDQGGTEHAIFDEVISMFYTEKEHQIKRHYNNPFSQIYITIYERTIKKKGDKLIITVTEYHKRREYNAKHFRSNTDKVIFSFDFAKGNFSVITQSGRNKNIKKMFRVNNFRQLFHILDDSPGLFNVKKSIRRTSSNEQIKERYFEEFDDRPYLKIICEYFGIKYHEITPKENGPQNFYKKVMEKFVELRRIKLPDFDYKHLLEELYPNEPFLKKNDRKLVAAILDANKIKSKMTIKLFHQHPFLPIKALVKFCAFFGDDYPKYLSALNQNGTLDNKKDTPPYLHRDMNDFLEVIKSIDINDDEKSNIVKYTNDTFNVGDEQPFLNPYFLRDLCDHFVMIDKIRKYDPNIRMKARTVNEFRMEHSQISKLSSRIKKGWTIEYQFSERMLEEIEKPVNSHCECKNYSKGTKQITLYPYILKREEEYIEEGDFMHHCVASYADKDKSIIVSIRTKNNDNRVTCEFDIASGKRIQARHYCNREVPEEFKDAVEEVSDKIAMHSRWGILNWKEKKKVLYKINGVEIEPNPEDEGSLNWW